MINKELMIKKFKDRIKTAEDYYDFLQNEIEKREKNMKHNEGFIFNAMKMMVYAEAEINILKDIIKNIKKGEFDKKQLKLN